jgi:Bacterial Ig-like domain (group 3)/FG-GAP-like repeat
MFLPENAKSSKGARLSCSMWILCCLLFVPLLSFGSTASTTTLTVTSGGSAMTTVASRNVVTLTATVMAGGAAVTTGQVNFCDATVSYCTDIHLLGTVQLTSGGTAVMKFVPGVGSHSYKAVFLGTGGAASSSSSASMLTVTGSPPSFTSIAETGSAGNYTLTANVSGVAAAAPTGQVSFVDTSSSNFTLGTAALSAGPLGLSLVNSSNPVVGPGDYSLVGDFNGDGKQDVINVLGVHFAFIFDQDFVVLLGNGDGTFYVAQAEQQVPVLLVVGDFNMDGIPDLVGVPPIDGNVLLVLLGNGDGTFTYAPDTTILGDPSTGAIGLVVGDFNGDGKRLP